MDYFNKVYRASAGWNLEKWTRNMVILGVVLAIVTGYLWYTRLYLTNEVRFWMAIDNSMATRSVTRTLTEGGSGNQVVQDYRFHYAPQRVIENKVSYTERSALDETYIETEGVLTPQQQFLRYSQFEDRRGEEVIDLGEYLGIWATSEQSASQQQQLNFLSEYVTLAVFGNYDSAFRKSTIEDMKQSGVYRIALNNVTEEDDENDRTQLLYSVTVNLSEYVRVLQDAFVQAGYGEFPALDPANYRPGDTVNAVIRVDKSTNTITGVSFGGRNEEYSNYGVIKTVENPEAELSLSELQIRLQQVLQ